MGNPKLSKLNTYFLVASAFALMCAALYFLFFASASVDFNTTLKNSVTGAAFSSFAGAALYRLKMTLSEEEELVKARISFSFCLYGALTLSFASLIME